jgi:hypothetical protein
MSKRKTNEDFIIDSKKIHGEKYNYSLVNYIKNNVKIKLICPEHGEFEITPNDHLSKGVGCNKCNNAGVSKKNNLGKIIIDKFNIKHNNFYDYSLVKYNGTDSNINIICPLHGIFEQKPHHHLTGHGCQECKNVKKLTNEKFIEKSKIIHGDKYDYSLVEYINNRNKLKIICQIHGEFNVTSNDHLSKKVGCPTCKESKGEIQIRQYLIENNIKFIPQKRFYECRNINPLPFDFYLPDLNMCIEYDGEQHFEIIPHWGGSDGLIKIEKKDKIKTNYCFKNNIELIRIKYSDDILSKLKFMFKNYV